MFFLIDLGIVIALIAVIFGYYIIIAAWNHIGRVIRS